MDFSPNKRYRGLCHNNITQKTKSEEKGTQEPDSDYLHVNWTKLFQQRHSKHVVCLVVGAAVT